jgi:MFS family permease
MRVPSFLFFSMWTGWHYRIRYMLTAFVLLVGSFLLMLLATNLPVLIAGQIVFGASAAFIYAGSLYYAMHVSEGAGGHAGTHEAMLGVGMVTGPLVGVIASSAGAGVPMIAVTVTGVLGVGLVALIWMARAAGGTGFQPVRDAASRRIHGQDAHAIK